MLYFYQPNITPSNAYLDGEEYQHCVKVLRKKPGDEIGIFDGKGGQFHAIIIGINKKQCELKIISETKLSPKPFSTHIAIAPTKNMDRLEWFVEKACELGVDQISLILTNNCERRKVRIDRLQKKAISALKQSKSGFLTEIVDLKPVKQFLEDLNGTERFMAFVEDGLPYLSSQINKNSNCTIMIGPEGDFTQEEVQLALANKFQKISLGENVLRTETAGLMAAHVVNVANQY
ncbi:MAG: 16S rRNA (uracil(1498)-N(3))-methyltransferase [Cyclobacteriaceae bacterium]